MVLSNPSFSPDCKDTKISNIPKNQVSLYSNTVYRGAKSPQRDMGDRSCVACFCLIIKTMKKSITTIDHSQITVSSIQKRIYSIRGVQVLIDLDLSKLYGVENRALKQAVRRNLEKFPDDFMFKLSERESNELISRGVSQSVIPLGYNTGGAEMFAFSLMRDITPDDLLSRL